MIACCLTGRADNLRYDTYQRHFRRIIHPVLDFIDVFAHVYLTYAFTIDKQLIHAKNITYYMSERALPNQCITSQYQMLAKNRACFLEVLHQPRTYEHIVRFRPDMEYGFTLPPPWEWQRLRHDVFLSTLVMPWNHRSSIPTRRRENRVGGSLSAPYDVFVDDNGAVVSMRHPFASAYFRMADEYDRCLHLDKQRVRLCGGVGHTHLRSPECSVMCELNSTSRIFVAEIPWSYTFSFVICTSTECFRRDPHAQEAPSTRVNDTLPTSHFAPEMLHPLA